MHVGIAIHLEGDINCRPASLFGPKRHIHIVLLSVEGQSDIVSLRIVALKLPGHMVPGIGFWRWTRNAGMYPPVPRGVPDVPHSVADSALCAKDKVRLDVPHIHVH